MPVKPSLKLLLLFLFTLPIWALAQKTVVADSVKAAGKRDSLKISMTFAEGRKLIIAVDKKGLAIMNDVLKMVEGKTASYAYRFRAEVYGNIGSYYNNIGKYDEAERWYLRAIQIGEQQNIGILVAKANLGLGILADHRSEYEKSIEKNLVALKYFENINDTIGIAAATGNIGNSYIRLDQHNKAIPLLIKATELYSKKGLKSSVANNMANLARAYKGAGNKAKEIELKLKAYNIYSAENNKKGLATVAGTVGSYYSGERRFDEALKYYSIALKNSWAIGDVGNIGLLYSNLARIYIKMRQPDKALLCADSSAFYGRLSGDRLAQADAALAKGLLLHMNADHMLGSGYIDRYISIRDSIYNGKMQDKVADMEVKYETAKKESAIALLKVANNNKSLQLKNRSLELNKRQLLITRQYQALMIKQLQIKNQDEKLLSQQLDAEKRNASINMLQNLSRIQMLEIVNRDLEIKQKNYAIIGIVVLLIAGGFLGYSFYDQYKVKQAALLQQELLKQQEQLTRAIITAEENERSRIASDLHDGVGQLFSAVKMNLGGLMDRVGITCSEDRSLAEKTMALVEESCKEVRLISHQMMPTDTKLSSGLAADVKGFIEKMDPAQIKVSVEATGFKNKLESNAEIVLYRVIQEAVNNVIKHARATTLNITLARKQNGITACISDNGVGFDFCKKEQLGGIGLKNIATRIEYLRGTVDFDSAPGKGTAINLWVPVV